MDSKVLLHICCAPDATHSFLVLKERYNVSGYFYNPNIHPEREYKKRLEETRRLAKEWGFKLYEGRYNTEDWFRETKGLEGEPEGGRRCEVCYRIRLEKTAEFGKEMGFDSFTTTLTISPHKPAGVIHKIGEEIGKRYGIKFLKEDFKKRDGFKKSVELSKELGLYRQVYCGCEYSREESFKKLVETIKRCKKCDLPEGSHPVFEGNLENRIMVIGQAPGTYELISSHPFSGKAGRNLFKWLKSVGIEEEDFRKEAYITAVMKCYPGKGDRRGDRKPSPEELKRCEPYLRKEAGLILPEFLILVGKLAIERFLGDVRLKEVVGRRLKIDLFGRDCEAVALPHPSGVNVWGFKKENRPLLEKSLRFIKRALILGREVKGSGYSQAPPEGGAGNGRTA